MYAHDSDVGIIHELKMPRPSARIDVAVVNGQLIGYEIKSDVDGLARLARQVRAFSQVFDHINVVTTEQNRNRVRSLIPEWWGVIVMTLRGYECAFEEAVAAAPNPRPCLEALVHILRRDEMLSLLEATVGIAGQSKKTRNQLSAHIIECVDATHMRTGIYHLLRARWNTCRCQ